MDKVEMGLAIAGAALGIFMNAKQPAQNNTAYQQSPSVAAAQAYDYVAPNISVQVMAKSTPNVKEARVKYKDGANTLISTEFIDCRSPRHKIIMMDYYENGVFSATEHVDFPYWEENNDAENAVMKVACSQ